MYSFRTVNDFEVRNKRILVRCDFNVPLDERGDVSDDSRIEKTLPTIRYLLSQDAKVILISHFGRPKGKVSDEFRLTPVQKRLSELLAMEVKKMDDCVGGEVHSRVLEMKPGEVVLLENLRFHPGEEENDSEFAQRLASLGDIYINDAFGVCHRNEASVSAITRFLPSGAGLLLDKEVKVLSRVNQEPWRPLVAIIGGVKIDTKLSLINNFFEKADHVLIGGEIANVIFRVKGLLIGQELPSEEIIKEVEKFNITSSKFHLPIDVIASVDKTGTVMVRNSGPGKVRKEEFALDIGPETVNIYSEIIREAKMIVWSGPMGFFEVKPFEGGTKSIAEAVAKNHSAYKIIGGGDTLFAASKFGIIHKMDHVSTGGGAMLAFLGGDPMPGLKALSYWE